MRPRFRSAAPPASSLLQMVRTLPKYFTYYEPTQRLLTSLPMEVVAFIVQGFGRASKTSDPSWIVYQGADTYLLARLRLQFYTTCSVILLVAPGTMNKACEDLLADLTIMDAEYPPNWEAVGDAMIRGKPFSVAPEEDEEEQDDTEKPTGYPPLPWTSLPNC